MALTAALRRVLNNYNIKKRKKKTSHKSNTQISL